MDLRGMTDSAFRKNKERWDAQRNTTVVSKLDRIIELLETLVLQSLDTEEE
jgi:ribosome assembly protein YihI (activator of Der GTPase)